MKNFIKLLSLLFILLIVVGCSNKSVKNVEKIKIGVIETTGSKYKSVIHWYDENLEVVDVIKLKYAGLGNTFSNPVYYKDDIYLIPEGIFNKKDTQKVISINKNDLSITEYSVPNIALNEVSVDQDYIYVNSNLNYQTHLSRINRKNKEFDELIFGSAYFSTIIAIDGKVFLFGNMTETADKNYMYVTNKDFKQIDSFEISKYGTGIAKYEVTKDSLYVTTNSYDYDSHESFLLKIDISNNQLTAIDLNQDYNDSIVAYKDKLFIAHNDIVTQKGSLLSVVDKNHNFETIDLMTDLAYIDIFENYLVVGDQEKISIFDTENDFALIKDILISKHSDTYISGIIIID